MVQKFNDIKTADSNAVVEKPKYDTKTGKIEAKSPSYHNIYINIQEFNKLKSDRF